MNQYPAGWHTGNDDDYHYSLTCIFVFTWWTVAMPDTYYRSLPSFRNPELEGQLLYDRDTANSRAFRYPGLGYTSRTLITGFSPLLKWDSAANLIEKHIIRYDLTRFLTLESRPKREKPHKLTVKSTLKILLNPNQLIFKPFIFSLELYESQDWRKPNKTTSSEYSNHFISMC